MPLTEAHHCIDHLLNGLLRNRVAADRTVRPASASEQQPQVVVNLGHRADGRARVSRAGLLIDRDRRRKSLDVVDIGFLHPPEELPGVSRQRLHVAPLAFGIDRVKGQRRLARTGHAGDHHQLVAGQFDVDVFEVVFPRAADLNPICRHLKLPMLVRSFSRSSVTQPGADPVHRLALPILGPCRPTPPVLSNNPR